MKRGFYALLMLVLTSACQKPYERAITDYIEEHLNDIDSYENVEIGKPTIITPMSTGLKEINRRVKAGEFPTDSINSMLSQLKGFYESDGTNPYDTLGWEIKHTYRAKNAFGGIVLCNVVYTFDKELKRITKEESK